MGKPIKENPEYLEEIAFDRSLLKLTGVAFVGMIVVLAALTCDFHLLANLHDTARTELVPLISLNGLGIVFIREIIRKTRAEMNRYPKD